MNDKLEKVVARLLQDMEKGMGKQLFEAHIAELKSEVKRLMREAEDAFNRGEFGEEMISPMQILAEKLRNRQGTFMPDFEGLYNAKAVLDNKLLKADQP